MSDSFARDPGFRGGGTASSTSPSAPLTDADVAQMSPDQRMMASAERATSLLGPEVGAKLKAILNLKSLGTMAGIAATSWAVAQFTPVGWLFDGIVLAAGAIAVGKDAAQGFAELGKFVVDSRSAQSVAELDAASQHLAAGVSTLGIDTVQAILLRKAAKEVKGKPTVEKISEQNKALPNEGPGGCAACEKAAAAKRAETIKTGADPIAGETRALVPRPPGSEPGMPGPRLPDKTIPGPPGFPDLPAREAPNFISAVPVTLPEGETLYRVVDWKANLGDVTKGQYGASGGYWTTERPVDLPTWRSQSAVKEQWNEGKWIVEATVPKGGVKAWSGPASSQSAGSNLIFPGGGNQIWVRPGTLGPTNAKRTNW